MNSIPQQTSTKKYSLNLSKQQRDQRSQRQREALLKRSQTANEAYDTHPNLCKRCGNPIPRRDGVKLCQIKRKKYCGSSCAAKVNNLASIAPKRKKTIKYCNSCGERVPRVKNRLCKSCSAIYTIRLSSKTKAECSRNDITGHARYAINGRLKACTHCGYNKAVQVCHIKAIKDFPPTATVAEINNPTNLVYLCPNCHWEFDHGLLTLDSNQDFFA